MLSHAIINRIRETVSANLDPRDRALTMSINRVAGELRAKGVLQSSRAVHQYIEEGRADFSGRAVFILQTITRSYSSMSGQLTETLRVDLHEVLSELLSQQADQVAHVVMGLMTGYIGGYKDTVRKELRVFRDEKRRQLEPEIDFYLDSLGQQREQRGAGPATVTIHGNVGAVQTGAGAVASVVVQPADSARLVEALDALRAAVERAEDVPRDQRQDVASLIDDTKAAIGGDRRSGPRIFGLLSGLGQAVQTVGSARSAWETVKDVAVAIGFALS